ncbi:hypothetical protein LCGC14_1342660 [marine sediment metagenome]|uniref:Uncharacterized protein n=1 Tax=marine sediment metagenome TaxID=412755 RepID=A0A0F9KD53_9ZZZZ
MGFEETVLKKWELCELLHGDHKWLAVTPWIVDKEHKAMEAQAELSYKAGRESIAKEVAVWVKEVLKKEMRVK